MYRKEAKEAAAEFVDQHFPLCQCALLAGSTVRGEATISSDLDIVIFDEQISGSYRESFRENGWPIEVFVHNFRSYQAFFQSDCSRARPSLPTMVAEGTAIKGEVRLKAIKAEAEYLLEKGPEAWTEETIGIKRYFLTDLLDDFIGSSDRSEDLFIASALSASASEFVLRTNGRWIGQSKWIVRALRNFDQDYANNFTAVFNDFYRTGQKAEVIKLVDNILIPCGGRLFEGFSQGKKTHSNINGKAEKI
ncbi:nucleotidyltransferase domain-containing protein [Planomicrobium soli]|uniref:nucleotidyltransferase domain-containing protein n=1 Tax=Planomicrobium soli TaxID=1176648 RepID=UPI000D0DFEB1